MSRRRKCVPKCLAYKVCQYFLTTSVLRPLAARSGRQGNYAGHPQPRSRAKAELVLQGGRGDVGTERVHGAGQGAPGGTDIARCLRRAVHHGQPVPGPIPQRQRQHPVPGSTNRALVFLLLEEVPHASRNAQEKAEMAPLGLLLQLPGASTDGTGRWDRAQDAASTGAAANPCPLSLARAGLGAAAGQPRCLGTGPSSSRASPSEGDARGV